MLVFVFDPLAVMLVIAANQTLLRYGINLEKTGPDIREQLKDTPTDDLPKQPSTPSAVDDAADVMSGYNQPTPMIVEKEVIKEIIVEKIKYEEVIKPEPVEIPIFVQVPVPTDPKDLPKMEELTKDNLKPISAIGGLN